MAVIALIFFGLPMGLIALVVTLIVYYRSDEYGKKTLLKAWGIVICILICIPIVLFLLTPFWTPMTASKSDNYGEYVIDRDMFKGKQADWQYNHYRFEIKEDNTFLFHVTNKEKILKTYKGTVSFISPRGESYCVLIDVRGVIPQVIDLNPTMYTQTWSFYYVFKSRDYGNMFFKKGEWEPTEQ